VSGTGSDEDAISDEERARLRRKRLAENLEAQALAAAHRVKQNSHEKPGLVSPRGDQQENRRIFRELIHAGVPEQYRAPKWDLCQQRDTIKNWCAGISRHLARGRGLVLLGDMGTGKSFAASLVAQAAIRAHRHVRWTYQPELLNLLQDRSTRLRALNQQIGADLVVWDDFGVRDPADWEVELLDEIVERRYAARRAMVVTSNWTRERFDTDIRLGRMMDRWRERMQGVYFVGASQRRPDVDTGPHQETLI
jgi:DNA replication protein DnaC